MKYAYEDLSESQFENLIVFLTQEILGMAVQGFSQGPDGGRDAKFIGVAELHPSRAKPWTGTTIIQAKHTNGFNKSFSDVDFHSEGSANTVLGKELPRINNLCSHNELDNYMLFSNRKLSGNAESKIRHYISSETGISLESIYICGVEQLEMWLKRYPDVVKLAELDPVDSPLIVSPDELAVVVEALVDQKAAFDEAGGSPPQPRVSYEKKNQLNKMSEDYAKIFRQRYLKETAQIRGFLSAPENKYLLEMYETVIEEFQSKIISKRKDYQGFEEVMEYLFSLLFKRDEMLKRNKKLTRTIIFYMYWNCDIGVSGDA